jgi:hypothetical protein
MRPQLGRQSESLPPKPDYYTRPAAPDAHNTEGCTLIGTEKPTP